MHTYILIFTELIENIPTYDLPIRIQIYNEIRAGFYSRPSPFKNRKRL